MNFWKALRLLGSVIVLVLAVLALVSALLHRQDMDADPDAQRPAPTRLPRSGPTGL